jgi:hypothetical protein
LCKPPFTSENWSIRELLSHKTVLNIYWKTFFFAFARGCFFFWSSSKEKFPSIYLAILFEVNERILFLFKRIPRFILTLFDGNLL